MEYNPQNIPLKPHTLVLLGGCPGAGKTTFAKKLFNSKRVIEIDDLYLQALDNIKGDVKITQISHKDLELKVMDKTLELFQEKFDKLLLEDTPIVLVATHLDSEDKISLLMDIQEGTNIKHIVQIFLNPPLPTLLSHQKNPDRIKRRKELRENGLILAPLKEVIDNYFLLNNIIKTEEIQIGASTTYIITQETHELSITL